MRYFLAFCSGILLSCQPLLSQAPERHTATDIYHELQKLNFLGNALYIAAHPDDENTRLISYLSNEVKARTAYLSLTRGDGGQNLIGPELRESLGVLRTQELLAARRVDGGEQFFTRANDFGYSKHPGETLKIWDKDSVLSDVVWVIRNFRPDVIINRFDHRSAGSTHGHHTSSAMLSLEAFDLAANATAYSGQLDAVSPWQPKRVFFNTSWWFYGSPENFEKADKSRMLELNTGVYYPMKGLSNNEIASMASNQHLCQGFGRTLSRGSESEYLELLKGSLPKSGNNLFEGIDTSWSRVAGGKAVGEILYPLEEDFDFTDPSKHLPALLEAHKRLKQVGDTFWKDRKLQELEGIIEAVCGLYLEASASEASASPGESSQISLELLNRSNHDIVLNSVTMNGQSLNEAPVALTPNNKIEQETTLGIPATTYYTSPYWLVEKGSLGMYKVPSRDLIGKPESSSPFVLNFNLSFNNYPITISKPVVYKYSKPEKGEIYQRFEVLPPVSVAISEPVMIFANGDSREVPVTVRANKDSLKGTLSLTVPVGWNADRTEVPFEIATKGEQLTVLFKLSPPEGENEGIIVPRAVVEGSSYNKELRFIQYDHIPAQSVLLPAETKVVRLDIRKEGQHIGYIMGAGDQIPENLEQIGYTVHLVDPNSIDAGSLAKYDAVVLGIRAYNVVDELKFKQRHLLDYVKDGGTLVIQYNTIWRGGELGIDNLAPYPLKVSRERVSEESAEVTILAEEHPLVNFPNRITTDDFKGWEQERGLYFPSEWDPAFTPVLSMHDEGEAPLQGGLLVAPYGEGYYIYTGLSFFRELPAGVPGAFKLFANMLSIKKHNLKGANAVKG